MENCPTCNELAYGTHEAHGIKECNTCETNVCSKCLHGCRYTCPLATLPPPTKLERQLSNFKWENAENFMREHPEIQEMTVQLIPGEHLYKIVREKNNVTIRLHCDRFCAKCGEFFLHTEKEPRLFVCPDCLKKK